jgi:hypothetical protein
MKRITLYLSISSMILVAGCSSTKSTTSLPDDVYYAEGDKSGEPQPASAVTPANPDDYSNNNSNYNPDQATNYDQSNTGNSSQSSSNEQYTDEKGNTYITNNYYNEDDYYDYQYSARLKRFYSPAIGYGYYDPFYTNSYWYDYNPYNLWGQHLPRI